MRVLSTLNLTALQKIIDIVSYWFCFYKKADSFVCIYFYLHNISKRSTLLSASQNDWTELNS